MLKRRSFLQPAPDCGKGGRRSKKKKASPLKALGEAFFLSCRFAASAFYSIRSADLITCSTVSAGEAFRSETTAFCEAAF